MVITIIYYGRGRGVSVDTFFEQNTTFFGNLMLLLRTAKL